MLSPFALNMGMYLFALNILGKYLELELLEHMVMVCVICLLNCHTLFLTNGTVLHSHQQSTRDPISPYQYITSYFWVAAILMNIMYFLIVSICIPLMIDDLKHYFTCILAMGVSS